MSGKSRHHDVDEVDVSVKWHLSGGVKKWSLKNAIGDSYFELKKQSWACLLKCPYFPDML